MSRPPRVSREEILTTARAHFVSRGHSASIQSIARALGLSHSALLQRFGSKRALLIESMRPPENYPWSQEFLAGPPTDQQEARAQLEEVGSMLSLFLQERMPEIMVLQSAGITPQEIFEDRIPLPLIACQQLAGWIQRGIAREVFSPCDAPSLASMLVGVFFARSRLTHLCSAHLSESPHDLQQFQISTIGSSEGVIDLIAQLLFK